MIEQDEFNIELPENIGRPLYWSLNTHIQAIENMIRSDEIQIALTMIDHVPAWWRDKKPPELENIRKTLYQRLYDQIEYATDDEEAECTREFGEAQWDNGYMFPRAEIIAKMVKDITDKDMERPWIFDLGSSHGNLPLGLMKAGLKFHYKGVGLNSRIGNKVKEWTKDHWKEKPSPGQTTILYCTEVIEHAFDPMSIVQSAYKIGVDFDKILLSVPLGCLGGGLPDWATRRLGHVRGWTVNEFLQFADKNFPGYSWEVYPTPSLVIVGSK